MQGEPIYKAPDQPRITHMSAVPGSRPFYTIPASSVPHSSRSKT